MGYAAGTFSARSGHQLQLNTALASQDVASNSSVVNWSLYAVRTSSSSSYRLNNDSTWSVNINGNTASGLWSYDFRNTASYLLGSGSYTIPHNSDGSKTYGFSASANAQTPLGTASASGSEALPTIARASNSTFSPSPMVAGSAATISTHRASTGFTHTITYAFGSQSGTIGTGVGDSVGWTPPLGLLNEIPNSVSGTGTITTVTYSGGTNVGSTTINFTVNAPASVIPTIGSVTASEAVSAVASSVGSLVQAVSKLNLAIVSAAGAYGSTITANKIVVDGQTINAASGTSGALASSGTLTITATVTDSRGRTGVATASITVLAYTPPTIDATTLSVKRSFVNGTLNDDGTYIKALFTAGAKSLVNGTEKNTLTYKILTRQHGNTVWNLIKTVTPSGVTFTGSQVIGTYDISHSWDVLIQAIDLFATTSLSSTVATAAIFMHWDASLGMGIGKYHENGMLDVAGPIYQNNGDPVMSQGNADSLLPVRLGVNPQNISSAGDFNAVSSTGWTMGYNVANAPTTSWYMVLTLRHNSIWCVQTAYGFTSNPADKWQRQQVNGTWTAWLRVYELASEIQELNDSQDSNGARYMKQVPLRPLNSWILYSDNIISDVSQQFGEPLTSGSAGITALSSEAGNLHATITSTGIVQLQGLLYRGFVPSSGTTILQLPVGMRPARTQVYQGFAAAGWSTIAVQADGNVVFIGAASSNVGYVSLSHIRFRASGYGTFTALTPISPWTNLTVAAYSGETGTLTHTAGYTTDADGVVLFEGIVTNTSATAGTTNIAQPSGLPSLLGSHQQVWGSGTQTYARYGASGGGGGSGNFINTSPAQAVNSYVGLGQMMILLPSSSTTSWKTTPTTSSWKTYDAANWATPQIAKTPDGLVLMKGLLNAGTMGAVMMVMGPGWRPRYNVILATASNAALSRVDVSPLANAPGTWTGSVVPTTGSNAWYSLDGLSWPAYR